MLNFFDKKEKVKEETSADIQKVLEERANLLEISGGLPTKWLELGVWYTANKKKLFLILTWTITIIAAVVWAYCLYFLSDYIIHTRDAQENEIALSNTVQRVVRKNPLADYSYNFVKSLPIDNNRYDFVGTITNKSNNIWLGFNYHFEVDGKSTEGQASFVLPGETKYLLSLGQTIESPSYNVLLVIDNLSVNRIKPKEIPDWKNYYDNRMSFVFKDKTFVSGGTLGLSERLNLSRVSFNVANNSAYNFRQVPFSIILKSGTDIVGVDRYIVNDFKSRARKYAELSVLGKIDNVDYIEVYPDINIADSSIYSNLQ